MMDYIWKYPIKVTDKQFVRMPRGSKILSAQVQGEQVYIWASVRSDNVMVDRCITIIGTGMRIHIGQYGVHIGTIQKDGFVWHIFDMGETN